MRKRSLRTVSLCILAAALLAACGGFAAPTGAPTVEGSPTSSCPSVETITSSLATPQPADVLLELTWEGGFTRQELAYAFGRVPEFSLLPDGSAYYRDPSEYDRAQVMEAHLTPAETDALVQRLLELGIERLESYTDECQPAAGGTCLCVADAGQSVLRIRLPGGEMREIRNYYTFANDPEALAAIRTLLEEYQHPQAEPYAPEKAALFVRPLPPSSDLPTLDWPLDLAWLAGGTPDTSCVRAVSGSDLQALLAMTGRNTGDFYFRAADQVYNVYLVPWLPGVDYADLIASSDQGCPPVETSTLPCAPASTDALPSRLIVEEHPLSVTPKLRELGRTAGPGFWLYFETADGDTGQILARNQALRDAPALVLASNNAQLGRFGYRLALTQCGDPGSERYALYQGDRLYLDSIVGLAPVSVNASGTGFVLPLYPQVLTEEGLLKESDSTPIYVSDELLTLIVSDTARVYLGDHLVYDVPIVVSTVGPVALGSPWSYDSHWIVEFIRVFPGPDGDQFSGYVVQDGQNLNEVCGYEETFNFALLDGRPFYFFQRDGKIHIHYDGQEIATGYDAIPHYHCCSAAVLNPSTSPNMVWFYAKRDEQEYYVEAFVPPAETPPPTMCPTPTPVVVPTVVPLPTPATLPGTPQPGASRTREADGMVQRYVPAGPFHMGSPEGVGEENEHPQHIVNLEAFWIDQTEVTNAQYQKCVQAGACRVQGTDGYDPQGAPEFPVAATWAAAQSYCRWAGGRLPSEAEWEKAARGTDARIYPWGDEEPDCTRANHDSLRQGFCFAGLAPVGSTPAGASPYGVLDMVGNAEEWVNDWYAADYYAVSPEQNPPGPDSGEFRVARGNNWYHPAEYIRAAYRAGGSPDGSVLGFRCATPSKPPLAVTPTPGLILSFDLLAAEIWPGEPVTLTWNTRAEHVVIESMVKGQAAGRPLEVPPSGSLVVTTSPELRNSDSYLLRACAADGRTCEEAQAPVEVTCPNAWNTTDRPAGCPRPEFVELIGQRFEHGLMLASGYLSINPDANVVILYDAESDSDVRWQTVPVHWDPSLPEEDPAIVPPPGFYEPVRWLGRAWHEGPRVRELLGWATGVPIDMGSRVYDCEAREHGRCYMPGPDDTIYALEPGGVSWFVWSGPTPAP
jgi:formylglycine-generating enzyme required for sulfatase activity